MPDAPETHSDCLFCRIVHRDIPATIVLEEDVLIAFRDIAPQAPRHVLIVPKTHIARLSETAGGDAPLLGRLLLAASRIASAEGLSDYRVVLNNGSDAGQSVFHLHLHLLGGRTFSWPPG